MESKDKFLNMYRDMVRIRRFEETVSDLFSQDRICLLYTSRCV